MRYIGTIIRVNSSSKWAWIGRDSLQLSDGTSTKLPTAKDIYLHQDDCDVPLSVGLEVGFQSVPDERRPVAFRAIDVHPVVYEEPGIELHIDDTRVDNPSIPMRWCFSGAMHAHMTEGLSKGYGYAVMIVAKKRNDVYGYREIREVRSWWQTFTITTFGSPGEWDVSIILYERLVARSGANTSAVLEEGIKEWLLAVTKDRYDGQTSFDRSLPNLHDLAVPEVFESRHHFIQESHSRGHPIAVRTLMVNVPREIFAKEPSKAVKEFGNYFFRHKAVDQCDFRRRLLFMAVGWIPYLVWEVVKRFVLAVVATTCLLFFVRDWWKIGDTVFEARVRVEFFELSIDSTQATPFNRKEGLWHWCTPGFLILYALAGNILLHMAKFLAPSFIRFVKSIYRFFTTPKVTLNGTPHHSGNLFWWTLLIAVAIVLGSIGAVVAWNRSEDWRLKQLRDRSIARDTRERAQREADREFVIESGKSQAALAERQFTALVCGETPAVVALKAIPKELRTRQMLFAAFKQKVCRPFAR